MTKKNTSTKPDKRLAVLTRHTREKDTGYAKHDRVIGKRWIASGPPAAMLREAAKLAPNHQPSHFIVVHRKGGPDYKVWINFYLEQEGEPSRSVTIDNLSAGEARRFIRYAAHERRADHIIAITDWPTKGGR